MTDSTTGVAVAEERPRGFLRVMASGAWSALVFLWTWFFGAMLCLGPIGALAVIGWCLRFMQRGVYRRWWRLGSSEATFEHTLERLGREELERAPNWIVDQRAGRTLARLARAKPSAVEIVRVLPRTVLRSVLLNLKLGVLGIANVAVATLPAGALWLFAWYAGWNNSFHKGYEQAWVGPTTGVLGIALFVTAMLYVPLAQARQAVTGSWRAFYGFRVVRALIRERWAASALLALGYALASFPVVVARSAPTFMGNDPRFDALGDEAVREALLDFWLAMSLWLFPVYVLLRVAAARIYATALPRLVERGTLTHTDLHTSEVEAFAAFDIGHERQDPERPALIRAFRWSGSRIGRATGLAATLACWTAFSFHVFVVEFFGYHPFVGWLNLPLIHLPWMALIPASLGG